MSMRHTDPHGVPASRGASERDVLGSIALAAAGISFAGFLVLLIGHLLDPSDFNNGKHPSPANDVAFFAFVVGLLIALVLGTAVWFYGRRSGRSTARSHAALGAYYGFVALVAAVVIGALGG